MRSVAIVCALWALEALSTPVLDARYLPGGEASHQHNHLELHQHHSRQKLALRAFAPGGSPESSTPQGSQDTAPGNPPASHDNSSPVSPEDTPSTNGKTPAKAILDEVNKLYGESIGTGPCDDWAGNPDGVACVPQKDQKTQEKVQQPHGDQSKGQEKENTQSSQSSPQAPQKHVKIVDETVVVVVTKVLGASSPPSSSASSPSSPAPPPHVQQQAAQQQPPPAQKQAAQQQPPSNPPAAEQHSQEQPKSQAKEQPKPQPKVQPQEQPKAQSPPPQEQNSKPPATQGKPQPTKEQPPGDSNSGSKINTDGLPMDFVDELDSASDIFKGLSKLHHDIHRHNHSLPALVWNDTLYEYAKETAESCIYGHSLAPGGGGYGQNIASGNAPGNISAVLTNGFYNAEIEVFKAAIAGEWGCNTPDMADFETWGHFTQMIWEQTTSFACYTATCSPPGADPLQCNPSTGQSYLKNVGCGNGGTKAYNTVCNYYPPGNYAGQYAAVPGPQGILGFVEMTGNGVVGLS